MMIMFIIHVVIMVMIIMMVMMMRVMIIIMIIMRIMIMRLVVTWVRGIYLAHVAVHKPTVPGHGPGQKKNQNSICPDIAK